MLKNSPNIHKDMEVLLGKSFHFKDFMQAIYISSHF